MKTIGNWFDRVDTPEGIEKFQKNYKYHPVDYMERYQVDYLTELKVPTVCYIAILEYDGTFNQIFALEEGETINAYSSGCMADEGRIFNTDGMAFMTLVRDGQNIATFCLENSPYDAEDDDFDEMSKEEVLENLNEVLGRDFTQPATESNTLFVRQL